MKELFESSYLSAMSEENDRLRKEIERLNKENKELNKICARKSHYIDKKDLEITELKIIIDKAINYCCYLMGKKVITALQIRKIRNILRGVDKE